MKLTYKFLFQHGCQMVYRNKNLEQCYHWLATARVKSLLRVVHHAQRKQLDWKSSIEFTAVRWALYY